MDNQNIKVSVICLTYNYKYANFIQGGRYLDILGVGENEVTYNSENTGYCLSEIMESNSASTAIALS